MYCKHCGKQIADDAKFCDSCGKSVSESQAGITLEEPKKKKKKRHPILGTIILIFTIFIVIGILGGGDEEPKKVEVAEPAATVAAAESTEAQPFTVGDTLEMDGILVTLNDVVEHNGTQYMKPTDGNVFVTCEFTIENQTDSEIAVSSMLCFKAYFDDYATNINISAMVADQSKNQLDGAVAAGKKINGVVGYEAPDDWSEIEIHFTPAGFGSKSFIFVYSK